MPAAPRVLSKTRNPSMGMVSFGNPIIRALNSPSGLLRLLDVDELLVPSNPLPSMLADIRELDNSYQFVMDVPGVDKKDISISVSENVLTVESQRESVKEEEEQKEGQPQKFKRFERSFGKRSRVMHLPPDADTSKIEAKCADGVLTITIPKVEGSEELKTRTIEVQ